MIKSKIFTRFNFINMAFYKVETRVDFRFYHFWLCFVYQIFPEWLF